MIDLEANRRQASTQVLEKLILSYCVMKQQCLEKLPSANSNDMIEKLQITINNCESTMAILQEMLSLLSETNEFSPREKNNVLK